MSTTPLAASGWPFPDPPPRGNRDVRVLLVVRVDHSSNRGNQRAAVFGDVDRTFRRRVAVGGGARVGRLTRGRWLGLRL